MQVLMSERESTVKGKELLTSSLVRKKKKLMLSRVRYHCILTLAYSLVRLR